MKIKIIVLTLLVAILLAACSNNERNLTKEDETNIKELVHDYSVGNIKNQSASITSRQLVVTAGFN